MTKLEDLLPAGTQAEWTCGHIAGAVCAECYRQLAQKAHELAEENIRLRGFVSGCPVCRELDRLEPK
jgi:Zn ribbon nucleic-acid-binding protein